MLRSITANENATAMTRPLVVLLHGLARGHGSMAGLARFLRANGFDTFGRTYPSRRHSISYLAAEVADWIRESVSRH